MNRKELYQKSIDILLDAYNEGKLKHGEPCACAVGNLITKNYSVTPIKDKAVGYEWSPDWYFTLVKRNKCYNINGYPLSEKFGTEQIRSTGYSIEEIIRIEGAFEGRIDEDGKDGQYYGLCAVLDTLKEIHEAEIAISEENQTKLEEIHNNKLQLV